MRAAALLAVCLVCLAFVHGSARAESRPRLTPVATVKSPIRVKVIRLGPGQSAPTTPSMHITAHLPAGARQGPRTWYLVRLRVTGLATTQGRFGQAQLGMAINGYEGLQILLGPEDGSSVIDELDLLRGHIVRPLPAGRFHIDEANYVQIKAIRPGTATVTADLTTLTRASAVSSITLEPGSGLYKAAYGPPDISVKTQRHLDLRDRGRGRVTAVVTDDGWPVRSADVTLSGGANLVVLGARTRHLGTTGPSQPRTVTWFVKARRPGRDTLQVAATGATSEAQTRINVRVDRLDAADAADGSTQLLAGAILFIPAALFAVMALVRRRNEHPRA